MKEILNFSIRGEHYIPIEWKSNQIIVENGETLDSQNNKSQWIKLNTKKVTTFKISKFVNIIYDNYESLIRNNADEIQFWLLIIKDNNEQCNIEFSTDTLDKLNKMNATICIEFKVAEL